MACSLVRGELGRSSGTNTDLTVTNGLVSHGELSEIVTNHVSLNLDGVPVLATVAFNDRVAHLWHNDAVSKVGFDGLWLLTWRHVLLGLSELLHKSIVLGSDATSESSSLPGTHEGDNLLVLHI